MGLAQTSGVCWDIKGDYSLMGQAQITEEKKRDSNNRGNKPSPIGRIGKTNTETLVDLVDILKKVGQKLCRQLDGEKERTAKQLPEGMGVILTEEKQQKREQSVFFEKKLFAVHEAGHVVLAHLFAQFDWHEISHLLQSGKEMTIFVFYPREYMVDQGYTIFGYRMMQMVVAHRGCCAEYVVFDDDIAEGGREDHEKLTKIDRELKISSHKHQPPPEPPDLAIISLSQEVFGELRMLDIWLFTVKMHCKEDCSHDMVGPQTVEEKDAGIILLIHATIALGHEKFSVAVISNYEIIVINYMLKQKDISHNGTVCIKELVAGFKYFEFPQVELDIQMLVAVVEGVEQATAECAFLVSRSWWYALWSACHKQWDPGGIFFTAYSQHN